MPDRSLRARRSGYSASGESDSRWRAAALALGMHVIAFDPFVSRERFRELGVEGAASQDDVLASSDVVSLHLPLTDDTRAVISRSALDAGQRRHPHRQRCSRGARRRGCPARRARVGEGRRRRTRCLLQRAVHGAAARAGQRRRHAASRRVHRGGPGPGRGDRRRAGGGRARGRSRRERREHAGRHSEDIDTLGPFVPSRRASGRSPWSLAGGRAERIVLSYRGRLAEHDTRLLTVAALNGVFEGRTEQPVNAVNAALVAAERGIAVEEQSERLSAATTRASCRWPSQPTETRRPWPGRRSAAKIGTGSSGALDFKIEIELAPYMVFFQYDDRPGVIGRVGTLFGEAGINIANMAVSRANEGGKARHGSLHRHSGCRPISSRNCCRPRASRRALHSPGLSGAAASA